MSANVRGFIKFGIASFVIIGGAWQLYCMTPAGAAERDFTRTQREMAKLAQQDNSAQKQNIKQ